MTVRTKHLWRASCAASFNGDVYLTPVGRTTIVRTVTIVNDGATTTSFTLGIHGFSNRELGTFQLPNNFGRIVLSEYWVFQPGEGLRVVNQSAINGLLINGFGVELEGVAPA